MCLWLQIFPHHENERAQSEAACCNNDQAGGSEDSRLARFWMHNGFVNIDNEKMCGAPCPVVSALSGIVLSKAHTTLLFIIFFISARTAAPCPFFAEAHAQASSKGAAIALSLIHI